MDMFTRLPVRVCGEVELEIHHVLLAKCPRADIKEVYSRPQALSQCRNWLAKHLPGARTIEVTSTSTAAQLCQGEARGGGDRESPGGNPLRARRAGRADRGQSLQHHALCGHRRSTEPANRSRQDRDDVPGRASARRLGRRAGHLQAEPAQPHLDRIVSDPGREGLLPVLRRDGGARGPTSACAERLPRSSKRRSAWKSSGPSRPARSSWKAPRRGLGIGDWGCP